MANYQNEKNEFLNALVTQVSELPVEQVVGRVVELVPKGQYYHGLCPFHPDNHLGSFVVTPSRGLWRCFAENLGGNGIKFEMEYYKIPFITAVFKLALDFGLISHETYVRYGNKRYDESVVSHIRSQLEVKKKVQYKKADPDVIANVYEAMAIVCPLSEAHREHLIKERHLSDEDMKDYFTFPTRNTNLYRKVNLALGEIMAKKKYGKELADCSEEEVEQLDDALNKVQKQFTSVPGFFKDVNTGRITFVSYKGIGFLVRDEKGTACGIQIRRDTVKEGETRYVWFSSAFAETNPELEGGAPSGAPGGVIFPKKGTGKEAICITEGRFKAQKIADKGNIAIYVSGVSTWKNIIPMVKALKGDKKSVFIMFDADVMGNVAVHRQMSGLADAVRELGLTPKLIIWSADIGKGFDDLVNNVGSQYYKLLRQVPYDDFESSYKKALSAILDKNDAASVRDIRPDQAEAFRKDMQNAVEAALACPGRESLHY